MRDLSRRFSPRGYPRGWGNPENSWSFPTKKAFRRFLLVLQLKNGFFINFDGVFRLFGPFFGVGQRRPVVFPAFSGTVVRLLYSYTDFQASFYISELYWAGPVRIDARGMSFFPPVCDRTESGSHRAVPEG